MSTFMWFSYNSAHVIMYVAYRARVCVRACLSYLQGPSLVAETYIYSRQSNSSQRSSVTRKSQKCLIHGHLEPGVENGK